MSRLEKLKRYFDSKTSQVKQLDDWIEAEAKYGCGKDDPAEGVKVEKMTLDYPDIQIYQHSADFTYAKLNETFQYTLKVYSKSQNKFIGWISVQNLGEPNVRTALNNLPNY